MFTKELLDQHNVTVKQPGSRGMQGFFVAIFSVVTQFDVCPVGWYNCRMEFLGRTILWERGDTTSYQFITFTLVNHAFLEPG